MKQSKIIFKAFIAIWMGVALVACGKDDDDMPQNEKGFFPAKITKTSTTNPSINRSFYFTYNSDNHITRISIVYPEGEVYRDYRLSYNSGLLTRLSEPSSITYNFAYSAENKLNNITLLFGTESIPVPVNYNATAHSYNLTVEGEITLTMNPDETFALVYESSAATTVAYTTADGVFADVPSQVALHLIFGGMQGLDYLFFHPYEVLGLKQNDTQWTLANTRDANGNITKVNVNGPAESYIYDITYEQREL